MLRKTLLLAALLSSVAGLAPAEERQPAESAFQVTFRYAGTDQVLDATVVPLLPGNACYNWYIRLAAGATPKTAVERLTLPEPISTWGDAATDPDDGIEIEADGAVAVKTFVPAPDADGWFSDGWCVAEGDPIGAHKIEVSVDGTSLATFDFEAVQPGDYAWPSIIQPDSFGRSVDNSW